MTSKTRPMEFTDIRGITPLHHFTQLRFLSSVDSTNSEAIRLCKAGLIKHGTGIIADCQTNGRGTFNKEWESKTKQDILFSFVIQPKFEQYRWSLVMVEVSVAVYTALSKMLPAGVPIHIKWPNDILINHKKCCGILAEIEPETGHLIIGIGINVNSKYQLWAHRASLSDVCRTKVNRAEVLQNCLETLNDRMMNMTFGIFRFNEYNDALAYRGQFVTLTAGQDLIHGELLGMSDDGELMIKTNSDGIRLVSSGHSLSLTE